MRKSFFAIDGRNKDNEIVEGYWDGRYWNGWCIISVTEAELRKWVADTAPISLLATDPKKKILTIHWEQDGPFSDEVLESIWIQPDPDKEAIEVYDLSGWCFVEMKQVPVHWEEA